LQRQHVDGFFFWTKNVGPFLPILDEVNERGYPFVVHHSITGYPRALEPTVANAEQAVRHLKAIRDKFSRRTAVWRYDPIVITTLTDFAFHRRNFARLAQALAETTDEVIVSFAEIYKKTSRNLDRAAATFGFHWENPDDDTKREFLRELGEIARTNGLRFSLCAQRQLLSPDMQDACCIDVARLSDISGVRLQEVKPGHRGKRCGCNQSRDIGAYGTCPHGCVYCYAVDSPAEAKAFRRRHDPAAESLGPSPPSPALVSRQGELTFT
jgi:DNA repair photolyase